jgi:hypothetical protein
LALAVNGEVKSKDVSNRLALVSVKSFNVNESYEGFGFEVKELCNINSIGRINKCKAIRSRVNKGS